MKRTLTIATSFLAALIAAPALAGSPERSDKTAKIEELLRLTGAGELGRQVATQMLSTLKPTMPEVPEAFWDELAAEIRPEELVALIVPVYEKHFTEDEIDGLIDFYASPLGKRLVEEQPAIAQESMAAGRGYGEALAERITARLKEKGYVKT